MKLFGIIKQVVLGKKWFGRKHDIILFYTKSDKYTFNPDQVLIPRSDEVLRRIRTGSKNATRATNEYKLPVDVWDIKPLNAMDKERLGYPTQKPQSLLERIIEASSNKNDIVLDPFCGCGTTIGAAMKKSRQWIGIDISSFAIDIIKEIRLEEPGIATKGIPYDLTSARKLAKEEPFEFESWAVTRLPGFIPNTKQVADGGVDGRATLEKKPDNQFSKLALAQVKGGKFSLSQFRDFIHVLDRDNAATGCFITLEKVRSQEARKEALKKGWFNIDGKEYQRVHLWPLSEYFDGPYWPPLPMMADPYTGKSMQQMIIYNLKENAKSSENLELFQKE